MIAPGQHSVKTGQEMYHLDMWEISSSTGNHWRCAMYWIQNDTTHATILTPILSKVMGPSVNVANYTIKSANVLLWVDGIDSAGTLLRTADMIQMSICK